MQYLETQITGLKGNHSIEYTRACNSSKVCLLMVILIHQCTNIQCEANNAILAKHKLSI